MQGGMRVSTSSDFLSNIVTEYLGVNLLWSSKGPYIAWAKLSSSNIPPVPTSAAIQGAGSVEEWEEHFDETDSLYLLEREFP